MNNGQHLLGNFITDGHVDRHYQLGNDEDLRLPLHLTPHPSLAVNNYLSDTEQLTPGITQY